MCPREHGVCLGVRGVRGEQPRPPSTRLRGSCTLSTLYLLQDAHTSTHTCVTQLHVCTLAPAGPRWPPPGPHSWKPLPGRFALLLTSRAPLCLEHFPPAASPLSPWWRDGVLQEFPPLPVLFRLLPRTFLSSQSLHWYAPWLPPSWWTLPPSARTPSGPGHLATSALVLWAPRPGTPCPPSLQSPWLQACCCVGFLGGDLARQGLTAPAGRPWLCPGPGQSRHSCWVGWEVGAVPARGETFACP